MLVCFSILAIFCRTFAMIVVFTYPACASVFYNRANVVQNPFVCFALDYRSLFFSLTCFCLPPRFRFSPCVWFFSLLFVSWHTSVPKFISAFLTPCLPVSTALVSLLCLSVQAYLLSAFMSPVTLDVHIVYCVLQLLSCLLFLPNHFQMLRNIWLVLLTICIPLSAIRTEKKNSQFSYAMFLDFDFMYLHFT